MPEDGFLFSATLQEIVEDIITKLSVHAEIEEQIERLSIQKDEAVKNAEYEEAARLRDPSMHL